MSEPYTDDYYRTLFDRLMAGRTYREFVRQTQSRYSIAWWSKYASGRVRLPLAAKNDLLRGSGERTISARQYGGRHTGISCSTGLRDRLDAARRERGMTWDEYLDQLL